MEVIFLSYSPELPVSFGVIICGSWRVYEGEQEV